MNRLRYSWLKGPNGLFQNHFDRGPIINVLEFIGCPCYHVDYMKIISLEEVKSRNQHTSNLRTDSESPTLTATELIAHTGTRVGNTNNPIYHNQHQTQQQNQSHDPSQCGHDHSHDHSHKH